MFTSRSTSAGSAHGPADAYCFAGCTLSVARRVLIVDGQLRPLHARPFDLLVYLIEHRDRVVPVAELAQRLWPQAQVPVGGVSDAVASVRKALGERGGMQIVHTYRRVGYRFAADLIE